MTHAPRRPRRHATRTAPRALARCAPPPPASGARRPAARASGAEQKGKATRPPGLADHELARRGVHRAAALQRDHAVEARGGHLAEGDGDRADRAQAVGEPRELRRGLRHPARVGRLEPHDLQAAGGVAALAGLGAEALPVQPRAGAPARPPLLAGTEVVDIGEVDVRHGGTVRHRDREGVMGQAALGVQRAVDRVDDHAHRLAAEAHLAALLGDRGEAMALVVKALELGEHRVLRGAVDDQRLVAALAATRLTRALARGRIGVQHRPQPAHRPPARDQPVGAQGGGGTSASPFGQPPVCRKFCSLTRAMMPAMAGAEAEVPLMK